MTKSYDHVILVKASQLSLVAPDSTFSVNDRVFKAKKIVHACFFDAILHIKKI